MRFANTTGVDENHALFNMSSPTTHAARRKLMARAFSKTEIRKNWEDEIRHKIDLALDKMGKAAHMHPTGEVDCQKWWMMMAADVSSKITFGESFDMLQEGVPDVPQENKYIDAISHTAEANTILAEVPNLDFVARLRIPFIQRLFKITDTVLELAALNVAKSKSGTAGAGNIFTGIIAEAEKSNSRLSNLVLGREARSLIIAGTDTTAITMPFIVCRVLSQPQLRDDLIAELTQQKERSTFAAGCRAQTYLKKPK
ncbi:Cytochrome p450 protein [Lasiodiplodia theobromae]|nr:Cytochrome p450 protein [Lasiodiplodia theobromae]KAF4535881.1 Cytochrome p450 protein [Lasiodiplodia theobromae]